MLLKFAFQSGKDALLHMAFPQTCSACENHEVHSQQPICLSCLSELPYTGFENHRNNKVEKLFWGRVPLNFATSTFHFTEDSRMQHILHQMKYKDALGLGIYMGRLMGYSLSKLIQDHQIDLCIPMPLHRKKLFSRGYNQATLLCKGIRETTQLEYDEKALIRIHHTETQTNKSRVERWENVTGIFKAANPNAIQGKNILIIDDVITTGASTESCAHALYNTGARSISIASLAYTN